MTLSEGLTQIGSALGALQTASNIVKNWTSLRSDAERSAKLIELNSQIMAAQTSAIQANAAQTALIEEVGSLKTRLADFETWDTEKERYELKDASSGAVVYALKRNTGSAEPSHWLCPNCYQNRKKSILQPAGAAEKKGVDFRKTAWKCYPCGGVVRIPDNISPKDI
jgi:hypothetical protein